MPASWSFGANVPANSRSDSRDGALAPGQAFGPYRIAELIGEGGSAYVYRAFDAKGGELALKLPKDARLDPAQRERFRREGEIAARLDCSSVVRVLAGGEVQGQPFVAYELCPTTGDFRSQLHNASLHARVRLCQAAAAAVAPAHAAGVVHRDLKPANLLVESSGRVRVADFGLAWVADHARLTGDGEVLGTPRYMAPEQTVPTAEAPGAPADVWALGVVLYEAICGALPFPATRWLELRASIRRAQPLSPRTHDSTIPKELEAVCLRALAREPEQRYPHARALSDALLGVLELGSLPTVARAAGQPEPPPTALTAAAFPLGSRGGFELREVLGRGGMGIVYRAFDSELGREVALKFVLGTRGARLERFRREGEVTASLNHPAILTVHGVGDVEGVPYLKYELVPQARTLDQAVAGLELRDRLRMLRDAARGLGHAHVHGVVHRDVKPDNLLVDCDGRVLVADFGLAATEGRERLTRTGAMVGTPYYMAPELVAGDRERVGPPTDVWALGVLLYELLSGERPFEAANLVQLSVQITGTEPRSLRSLDAAVDRKLAAVCGVALRKDPRDRYADGHAFADDLDAWLEGRPLSTASAEAPASGVTATLPWIALAGVVCAALAAGAYAATVTSPATSDGLGAAPAREPVVAAQPTPDPERLRQASHAWKRISALEDLEQQVSEAHAWSLRYAGHPQAQEAAELIAAHRFAYPLQTLQHGETVGNTFCTFESDDVLWVAAEDGALSRWDLRTLTRSGRWGVTSFPEVKTLVVVEGLALLGTHGGLNWFDTRRQTSVRFVEGWRVSWVSVTPDRRRVAVSGGTKTVRVLEASSGELLQEFGGYESELAAHAFTPDGKLLITLAGVKSKLGLPSGCQVCIWDLSQPEQPLVRDQFPTLARSLAVSPDSSLFAVGTLPGQVFVCDTRTGAIQVELFGAPPVGFDTPDFIQRKAHGASCQGLVFSHDGATLYSVSQGSLAVNNQLRVWNVGTWDERRAVVTRPFDLQWVALSPNGKLLAIGTDRGTVELWAAQ